MSDELSVEEIEYFRDKYGLFNYQLWTLNELLNEVDLRGKTVLEVGGSNLPRELVIGRIGAEAWHCVDMIPQGHYARSSQALHYAIERVKPLATFHQTHLDERYNIFDGMIHDTKALPAEHFDAVISIAAFEHIHDFDRGMRAIRRMMKPGGMLFSNFGPIWSCRVGHQMWVDDDLNFMVDGATPPFLHLLHERAEIHAIVAKRYGPAKADAAVNQIFEEPFINRLFYEDYEASIHNVGFSEVSITPSWREKVSQATQKKLAARYPGRHRFDAYNIKVLCTA